MKPKRPSDRLWRISVSDGYHEFAYVFDLGADTSIDQVAKKIARVLRKRMPKGEYRIRS